ncbi:MAG: dihydropteroate synthase [Synergistaceae bacterium]|nr:dihydropteroate synthase [Synergistaceae bacterium]
MQEDISVYPVRISGVDDVMKACAKIGTDPGALAYLAPKSNIIHIYAEKVDYRAAGFIKQEMLSRGGDAAVAKHVIDGRTDYSDILIMGTEKQILSLTEKMTAMKIWGIPALREKIAGIMRNAKPRKWELASPHGRKIILGGKTRLMAILNVTPDSFHEASRTDEREIAERAGRFLDEGAYILDVGAESTRPGACPVSESDEAGRLVPALRVLRREFPDALISVDTYKAGIARLSADEGADIINDISGYGFDSDMAGTVSELGIPYVLSHIYGGLSDVGSGVSHVNILGDLDR